MDISVGDLLACNDQAQVITMSAVKAAISATLRTYQTSLRSSPKVFHERKKNIILIATCAWFSQQTSFFQFISGEVLSHVPGRGLNDVGEVECDQLVEEIFAPGRGNPQSLMGWGTFSGHFTAAASKEHVFPNDRFIAVKAKPCTTQTQEQQNVGTNLLHNFLGQSNETYPICEKKVREELTDSEQ